MDTSRVGEGFFRINRAEPRTLNQLRYEEQRERLVRSLPVATGRRSVEHSYLREPLDPTPGRIGGLARCYACASPMAQRLTIDRLLDRTLELSDEDRVALLGIAMIESGFNPDAANGRSSAAGLFQFIQRTGAAYGLNDSNRFELDAQIEAAKLSLKDSITQELPKHRFRNRDERAVLLYALHHDGPSLRSGGKSLARIRLTPRLPDLRGVVAAHRVRSRLVDAA